LTKGFVGHPEVVETRGDDLKKKHPRGGKNLTDGKRLFGGPNTGKNTVGRFTLKKKHSVGGNRKKDQGRCGGGGKIE